MIIKGVSETMFFGGFCPSAGFFFQKKKNGGVLVWFVPGLVVSFFFYSVLFFGWV